MRKKKYSFRVLVLLSSEKQLGSLHRLRIFKVIGGEKYLCRSDDGHIDCVLITNKKKKKQKNHGNYVSISKSPRGVAESEKRMINREREEKAKEEPSAFACYYVFEDAVRQKL